MKDRAPLAAQHSPRDFPGRESQQAQLADLLAAARSGQQVRAWLYGPPGAGKSSLMRELLGAAEAAGARTVFLNCWSTPTFFSVVDGALNELRALVGDARDVAFKFERLARIARQELLVIALDEVDLLYLRERDAALYNLCQLERASIICLSNRKEDALVLDQRVRSRLQPEFIEFPGYSPEQLVTILRERADLALREGSWKNEDLALIAKGSKGDARIAITALRTAAAIAQRAGADRLRAADLEEGVRQGQQLRREYVLKELSEQHRLIYQLVADGGELTRKELRARYVAQTEAQGIPTMSTRTLSHYISFLVRKRLLEEWRGKGRHNEYWVRVMPP